MIKQEAYKIKMRMRGHRESVQHSSIDGTCCLHHTGVLQADDPEVEEPSQGHPAVSGVSRVRCVFCTNAQSVDKCQPATELLNGSCSPDVSHSLN